MTDAVHRHWRRGAGFLMALIFLGGCSIASPPVHFYTLSAMTPAAGEKRISPLRVVVGPIRVPGYLDRPQMVVRSAENQIRIVEYHRWADSPADSISLELAENLGVLLHSDHVYIHNLEAAPPPDYQVLIHLRRFEGGPDARVRLEAYWTIRVPGRPQLARRGKTVAEEAIRGKAQGDQVYPAMVDALSRGVKTLSREIAAAMMTMQKAAGS